MQNFAGATPRVRASTYLLCWCFTPSPQQRVYFLNQHELSLITLQITLSMSALAARLFCHRGQTGGIQKMLSA